MIFWCVSNESSTVTNINGTFACQVVDIGAAKAFAAEIGAKYFETRFGVFTNLLICDSHHILSPILFFKCEG